MPFHLDVHLLDSSYHASTLNRSGAEWPPHPYRLFCALVSVADEDDPVQNAALTWLEEQPPPTVRVPARSVEAAETRRAWVPTNAVERKKPGHAVLPGRISGGQPKQWPQRNLAEPMVSFIWPQCPSPGIQAVLELLLSRIGYFGRASGHALLTAAVVGDAEVTPVGEGWREWSPASREARNVEFLRAPYPGFLTRLRSAHAEGQRAFQQARPHAYQLVGIESAGPNDMVVEGPYVDLLPFAFPSGLSLDPSLTLKVTSSLRSKVSGMLSAAGHDVDQMIAVHGHKPAGDQRHVCAFVALPFVGHRHADGRLRGVGIALPRDLDPAHRKALLAVLLRLGGGLRKLSVPTLSRPVPLSYAGAGDTVQSTLQAVRAERWTTPSTQWTTALPMVLDHFPRRTPNGIETSVATSCVLAGFPEPRSVEVLHRGAYVPGAPELPPYALRRKAGERPLLSRHVRLRFAEPVTGPIILGSKKSYGLGLCIPVPAREGTA
ncbi:MULTISPECIES: type I-U CRISPR-associated protein Csb2 [unclassified Streptomyces]|uniref:type I-G CRISPR-associated protein Csb2 n=1 Tax=unclassified Streptomyces TaxID=2593676 RepID=UPI000CD5AD77|nr:MULTISPECIES: type I-U CRISPR-associated protein Csb2 [unclassified Streptomyces]AWL37214.1 type I-U CRISPR-associated protein Cas5/Cas6 [Streptomyces sp. SM18]